MYKGSVAICTLLSLPPFPTELKINTFIEATPQAERHMYRYWYTPEQQVAFAAVWGANMQEARSRIYRVINTCRQFDSNVQYRADVGRRFKFIFNQEKGEALLQRPRSPGA